MDTKWKKCKGIIGITAFVLGVSLLFGSFGNAVRSIVNYGYGYFRYENYFEKDYQNTYSFKEHVAGRLEELLNMAIGAPVSWYSWDYWYDEYEEEESGNMSAISETVVQAEEGDYNYEWSNDWESDRRDMSPAEIKKTTERFHADIKEDKNLLYKVEYDGEILYSNADGVSIEDAAKALSEGYNFWLRFDGSKVTIIKDGQELDVYGDSYYWEEDKAQWYVPGYKNFITDEGMKKAFVTMAIAKEPRLYNYSNYGQSGYRQPDNMLYWIDRNMKSAHADGVKEIICLIAGILLLSIYLLLRKDKKLAEKALSKWTGKIWFEAKLVVLIGIAAGSISAIGYGVSQSGLLEITELFINDWQYMREAGYLSGKEWSYAVAEGVFYNPLAFIILFWCIYLFVMDIKGNKEIWKHGLLYKLYAALNTSAMKLSVTKRMLHRCIPVLAASLLFGIAALLLALYVDGHVLDYPWLIAVCFLAGLAMIVFLQYLYIRYVKKSAKDIENLSLRITEIHNGKYDGNIEFPQDSELLQLAQELDDIRHGMAEAIEVQMKSERMKVELVANVSHDIKTPLTSIISYVEFLKKEENLPLHVQDYIKILDEKSQRLKNMVQDVFSVSKAASGQLPVNMEVLDFGKLLRQTMADMEEQIQQSSIVFKTEIPNEPVMIKADGQRLYRVFQNLIQNALKYSLEGSRVYITLQEDASMAVASVKNTSRTELKDSTGYAERFTRGDESRTDGGSGLGLSIAQSFTEACGGTFRLETIADLFVVTVSFAKEGR